MNNLLTALATKISGSALSTDVGGRIYLDEYPSDEMPATYPYIIYFIVSGNPDDAFNKEGKDVLIQFSLFSASSSAIEITNMYADLKTLFNNCSFTITSSVLVWMHETNLTTMIDEIIVADAAQSVKHWAVDYEITTEAA